MRPVMVIIAITIRTERVLLRIYFFNLETHRMQFNYCVDETHLVEIGALMSAS